MFQVIAQISFGLVAGLITELVKPSRNFGGIFATASFGLIGALAGAFAGRAVFGTQSGIVSWVTSILGALLVLSIYRAVFVSRTTY